jgi:hypothetical protein
MYLLGSVLEVAEGLKEGVNGKCLLGTEMVIEEAIEEVIEGVIVMDTEVVEVIEEAIVMDIEVVEVIGAPIETVGVANGDKLEDRVELHGPMVKTPLECLGPLLVIQRLRLLVVLLLLESLCHRICAKSRG